MDIGIHLLDLLFWWLPHDLSHLTYEDDNLGGMESFARIQLGFSNGIRGQVKISRLSVLKNRYRLNFERGVIEWDPLLPQKLFIRGLSGNLKGRIRLKRERAVKDLLTDFADSIAHHRKPLVSGNEAFKVIQCIERCYQSRRLVPVEWLQKLENRLCR